MTEIIAHRGTPRDYPENSIPGFLHALTLGAHAIELDVHATADHVLMVHHDASIKVATNRQTNLQTNLQTSFIREMTYGEVQAYPLANGVPMPTLAEVLAAIAGRAIVYVEIKASNIETAVVECIRQADATIWCAIHSFDHRVAQRVSTLAPEIPTGILLDSYLIDPTHALLTAHARDYWQRWDFIDAPLVDAVHNAGGRVIAWTVNAPNIGEALATLGVDGLCTDVAGALAGVFRATR